MIFQLEKRYVVPHSTTFSRIVIPNLYKEEKAKQAQLFKSVVKSLESLTMISDMWTSRAKDSFISCDVQFILCKEGKFSLMNITIDCKPFPGSHTADRICQFAYQMVANVGVDSERTKIYFVCDNWANIKAALQQPSLEKAADVTVPDILREEKPWTQLPCFDHTLQLAISDARKEVGTNTVIEKVSAIVTRYNQSSVARDNLKKFQKQTNTVQHEMVKNVTTRWNSDYAMLKRFLEQKLAVTMELSDAGEDNLNANQWKMIEGFVKVLKPIALFTADMGSTTQPTLSMVIPVLNEIISSLKDFISKPASKGSGVVFARALLRSVKERFPDEDYKDNKLYQVATALDPRFKDILMDKNEAISLVEREALRKLRQKNFTVGAGLSDISEPSSSFSSSPSTSPPKAKQSKWGHLQKNSHKRKPDHGSDEISIISKEVEAYLELPLIDANTDDPVAWWEANMSSFAQLVPLAIEYLGIAATEVQSERDFSIGGNTVTPMRTRLLTEHVQQFVFPVNSSVIL